VDFSEIDKCKPVLLTCSLAENLEKPLMSLYGSVAVYLHLGPSEKGTVDGC
jgi:hypothetical protein